MSEHKATLTIVDDGVKVTSDSVTVKESVTMLAAFARSIAEDAQIEPQEVLYAARRLSTKTDPVETPLKKFKDEILGDDNDAAN